MHFNTLSPLDLHGKKLIPDKLDIYQYMYVQTRYNQGWYKQLVLLNFLADFPEVLNLKT